MECRGVNSGDEAVEICDVSMVSRRAWTGVALVRSFREFDENRLWLMKHDEEAGGCLGVVLILLSLFKFVNGFVVFHLFLTILLFENKSAKRFRYQPPL